VIDESDSQCEKHFDPRISTLFGISNSNDYENLQINLRLIISRRIPFWILNVSLPDSIEIDDRVTRRNAEPTMN
jgi:hypothetical protein